MMFGEICVTGNALTRIPRMSTKTQIAGCCWRTGWDSDKEKKYVSLRVICVPLSSPGSTPSISRAAGCAEALSNAESIAATGFSARVARRESGSWPVLLFRPLANVVMNDCMTGGAGVQALSAKKC